MALRSEYSLGHSEYNAFLFAAVGEEKTGLPLTVQTALIRLGIDPERHTLYLMIGNPVWTSLEEGETYRLRFVFDRARTHDSDLEAGPLGDWVVLGRSGLATDFVTDFVASTGVRIDYRGAPIAHLSLRDARAALTEMTRCQQALDRTGGGNAAAVRPASDPFAR